MDNFPHLPGLDKDDMLVLMSIGAGSLVLLALGIGTYVFFVGREKKIPVRQAAWAMVSALWALPVAAIVTYLALQAAPHFQNGSSDPAIQNARPVAALLPEFPATAVEASSREARSSGTEAKPSFRTVTSSSNSTSSSSTSSFNSDGSTTVDDSIPEWLRESKDDVGNTGFKVLTSGRHSTRDEAKQEVFDEALVELKEYFHRDQEYPKRGTWILSQDAAKRIVPIRDSDIYVSTHKHEFGKHHEADMYQAHLRLKLSPTVRDELKPIWRSQIVDRRLWVLGSLVGMVTLILATTATYFRLDAVTNGTYRRRLKLAAVSLIGAGGLIVGAILPMV